MLSTTQLATVRTYVESDQVLSQLPKDGNGFTVVMNALNSNPAVDFFCWNDTAFVSNIYDAIIWSNLTPAQTADGTAIYTNRALICQAKQINLQIMLQGKEYINAEKQNIRAGLHDALMSVPSKVDGSVQGAGWAAVQAALQRKTNLLEKIFAIGEGSNASPATLTVKGIITMDEVTAALS